MRQTIFLLFIMTSAIAHAQNNFPASGNVGINLGASASLNKLQVGSNSQGWSGNDLVLSNGQGSLAIHNDVGHSYLYGSQAIAIRPGFGQMAVYAKSTGDVGIQSTNPQGTFQVGDYRPVVIKSNGGNGVYGSEIGFNAVLNTSVVPNTFRKLGGSSQAGGASVAVDYSGNMLFQMYNANTEAESVINYSPQVVFSNNGNVGIGSVSPTAKLHIYNTATFNVNESAAGQDHIVLSGTDPGNGGYFGGLTWESAGRRRASIAATREQADADYVGIAFFTRGADGAGPIGESMRITRDGNVGIGTSTPDALLTVKGDIHTREVRVDVSGAVAPDYVFEPTYNLLPLSEVESYIKANKHLPEVPSAKQMEEEGLNLKEMNLLLLKKVEELTLHLIEKERELNEMKKKDDAIIKRIDALEKKKGK